MSEPKFDDLDRRLATMAQDIIYPPVPDFTAFVRARARRAAIPVIAGWSIRKRVAYGFALAVLALAVVLAVSPDARAMLMPWWSSGSSLCPGRIAGKPLNLTQVTADELCTEGLILTTPTQRTVVSRAHALAAVARLVESPPTPPRFRERIYESTAAIVHRQWPLPAKSWFTWVVVAAARPARQHPLYPEASLLFVDARTGRLVDIGARNDVHTSRDQGLEFPVFAPPPNYQYSSIQFVNQHDGFLVASKAQTVLLTTVDAGTSWSRHAVPYGDAYDVQFVNSRDGWLIAGPRSRVKGPAQYLFRTTDGGRTWKRLLYFTGLSPDEVQFVNSRVGWLEYYGDKAPIQTTDGGRTWHATHRGFPSQVYWQFLNAKVGWATTDAYATDGNNCEPCGHEQLYVTADGGHTWTKRPARPGYYDFPAFGTAKSGWMVVGRPYGPTQPQTRTGGQMALLHTTNAGRTWSVQHSYSQDGGSGGDGWGGMLHGPYWPGGWAGTLFRPQFMNARDGWMLFGGWSSPAGRPLKRLWLYGGVTTTNDGGKTWHMHRLNITASSSVNFDPVSGTDAWLTVEQTAGDQPASFVLHTTDQGRHWRPVAIRIRASK